MIIISPREVSKSLLLLLGAGGVHVPQGKWLGYEGVLYFSLSRNLHEWRGKMRRTPELLPMTVAKFNV